MAKKPTKKKPAEVEPASKVKVIQSGTYKRIVRTDIEEHCGNCGK